MGGGFGGAGGFLGSDGNGRHYSGAGLITPPQPPQWMQQVTQQVMDWLYDKALELSHDLLRKGVLELGCGEGATLIHLGARGDVGRVAGAVGVDLFEPKLDLAWNTR